MREYPTESTGTVPQKRTPISGAEFNALRHDAFGAQAVRISPQTTDDEIQQIAGRIGYINACPVAIVAALLKLERRIAALEAKGK